MIETQATEVPCRDPECSGVAEPELDGPLRYFECGTCGFTFGYQQLDQPEEECAIGVPEEVRQQVSFPPEELMRKLRK